jgi:hypothetical protein
MFELMSKVKVDASDKETQQYEFDKSWTIWKFYYQQHKSNEWYEVRCWEVYKTAGLEELMRVNDSGKNIKILVKSGATDSQIKELWCLLKVVVSQTKPFWCHWR